MPPLRVRMLHKTLKSYHGNNPWDREEQHPDGLLWLLTPKEFKELPDGTVLESINGTFAFKGKDDIDLDDRFGFIAWGLRGLKDD